MPFIWLLLGGTCIGFAPNLVRIADTGPVASAFWRTLIAAPLLWLLVWAQHRRNRPATRATAAPTWRAIALWSGVCFAADLATWHLSIMHTRVANATLLANLAPVLSTLYAFIVHRQRPTPAFVLALALALGGAALLVGPSFGAGSTLWRGDLLAVVAACWYTGYLLLIKHVRNMVDTLRLMAWSTTATAIVLLPAALAFSAAAGQPFWPHSPLGWWVVIGLAVITQIGGQGLIAYASAHLTVPLSTTGLLIQPMVAGLVAWLAFGETLGPAQLAGAAVLMLGIYLARRSAQS